MNNRRKFLAKLGLIVASVAAVGVAGDLSKAEAQTHGKGWFVITQRTKSERAVVRGPYTYSDANSIAADYQRMNYYSVGVTQKP